jgi:copper chaperone CopZ
MLVRNDDGRPNPSEHFLLTRSRVTDLSLETNKPVKISKKYVNLALVPLLLGVFGVAVYVGYEAVQVELQRQVVASGAPQPDSPNSPSMPRNITVSISPKGPAAQIDAEAVREVLQSSGSVQSASLEGPPPAMVRLALVRPLQFSRLNELLQSKGTEIAVERSPLHGALRLHVTGMTCPACANRLKGQLSSLEGVAVKKIEVQTGHVDLAIADSASLTFAALKEAVAAKKPFQLTDVEWLMQAP